MMNKNLLPTLLAAGLLLSGCGKKEDAAAASATPAAVPANATLTVEVTANDAMKYSVTRIEAAAGQEVKISLTNIGSVPKAAMGHNLIVLKKGVDVKAFLDAAVAAMATEYFPTQLADQVLAHTQLLGPKQTDEITFKAPTEPGEYVFLCSFPAHYLTGMHGVLVVK